MTAIDIDLADLPTEEWLDRLDALGEEHGYFERIGPAHHGLFLDLGRTLLVTFETLEAARRMPGARPRGLDLALREGWSLLALFSDGDTWFRDRAVWGTFDRLTDDGFFEDFDRVLFFGAGSCGYAACALSVAAPGARVLALRPQATLATDQAGWDRRFLADRRRDFSTRYAYAPDMLEAALSAHVVYDPAHAPDAMHAALFTRDNVVLLRCPLAGPRIEQTLDMMGITQPLIAAAMDGTLGRAAFARLWRARRNHGPYLRGLLRRVEAEGREAFALRILTHGLGTRDRAWFARRLGDIAGPAPNEAAQ